MEQLEQKKLKKASSIDCEVKYSYSGSFCPLSYGPDDLTLCPQV